MNKIVMAALTFAVFTVAVSTEAQAKRHHHYRHKISQTATIGFPCVSDNSGRRSCQGVVETHQWSRQTVLSDATMLPHPSGCPRVAFCACGASVRVFGKSIRSLWPARAWYRFPRTSPASGMVAVRAHHVFVLESQVGGSEWLISDYNSGGHQSRRHVRSIAGYTIVNPHASASL